MYIFDAILLSSSPHKICEESSFIEKKHVCPWHRYLKNYLTDFYEIWRVDRSGHILDRVLIWGDLESRFVSNRLKTP